MIKGRSIGILDVDNLPLSMFRLTVLVQTGVTPDGKYAVVAFYTKVGSL